MHKGREATLQPWLLHQRQRATGLQHNTRPPNQSAGGGSSQQKELYQKGGLERIEPWSRRTEQAEQTRGVEAVRRGRARACAAAAKGGQKWQ